MRRVWWLFVFALTSVASAEPAFWETFVKVYAPGDALTKAQCNVCHAGPPVRNPYGRAVEAEMKRRGVVSVSPELLVAVEKLDSDGDGAANGAEIAGNTLPGDAQSGPSVGTPAAPPTSAPPLIPTHSFHPLFTHFPIALWLFGFFLEVLGARRGQKALRDAAHWNLAFGFISMLITVPTGVAAMIRMGFPLEGNVLIHLILALFGTFFSGVALMIRPRLMEKGPYWTLLLLSVACIGGAGHFGSLLVHG